MSSTVAESQTHKRRFGDAQILGMALLIGGALWLLDTSGVIAMSFITVLAVVLIILGAGMMLSGDKPQAGVIIAGIFVICLLVGASFFANTVSVSLGEPTNVDEYGPVPFKGRAFIGEATLAPTSPEELRTHYSFGVGEVTFDLSGVELPAGETPLSLKIGVGQLTLIVPSDVAVRGHAEIGAGEVTMFGRTLSAGTGGTSSFNIPAASPDESEKVLLLEIKGGLGEVEVIRAGF